MSGKYNTIVIDPPWEIGIIRLSKTWHRPDTIPYQTMSLEEITKFPIGDFANDGAHIYCWATNKTLPKVTGEIFSAWGVTYYLTIPMIKPSGILLGNGFISACEFCVLGAYGKPMQPFKKAAVLNWLKNNNSIPRKNRLHSRKPREFYSLVERVSPQPYIDIFSRQRRYGWDSWGNEVPEQTPTIEQFQT